MQHAEGKTTISNINTITTNYVQINLYISIYSILQCNKTLHVMACSEGTILLK